MKAKKMILPIIIGVVAITAVVIIYKKVTKPIKALMAIDIL